MNDPIAPNSNAKRIGDPMRHLLTLLGSRAKNPPKGSSQYERLRPHQKHQSFQPNMFKTEWPQRADRNVLYAPGYPPWDNRSQTHERRRGKWTRLHPKP